MKAQILGALLLAASVHAADTWFWKNPKPHDALYFDVYFLSPDTAVSVGWSGGIQKSTDGGKTWRTIPSPATDNLNCVRFFNSKVGYAAGDSARVIKTTDGGETWTKAAPINTAGGTVDQLAFTSPDTGYASYSGFANFSEVHRIYRTTDGGAHWTGWTNKDLYMYGVQFLSPDTAYAVGGDPRYFSNGVVLKTSNAGATWDTLTRGVYWSLMSVQFVDSAVGYACGLNGLLAKTVDSGHTWAEYYPPGIGQSIQRVQFPQHDTGYAFAMSGPVLKTEDGGTTWNNVSPAGADYLGKGHFISPGTGVVMGDAGKSYRTTDGALTWKETGPQGTRQTLNAVHFPTPDTGYAVGHSGLADSFAIVLRTVDGGATWDSLPNFTKRILKGVYFTGPGKGFAVGAGGAVYRTSDAGVNWETVTVPTNKDLGALQFPHPDTGYAIGRDGALLKTVDGGTSWTAPLSPSEDELMGLSFINGRTGYLVSSLAHVYKTVDGGQNWIDYDLGDGVPVFSIHFPTPDTGYLSGQNGFVYKTVDAGITWTRFTNINEYTNRYVIRFLDGRRGYAAGNSGMVVKTLDGGLSWTQTRLSTRDIYGLQILDAGKVIAVGARGHIFSTHQDNPSLEAPSPVYPAGNAVDISLTPMLTWAPSGDEQQFQLSTQASHAPLLTDTLLPVGYRTLKPLALATDYYWRVRGRNGAGASDWSTWRKFTTIQPPPGAVSLVSPETGKLNEARSPTLAWSPVSGATLYRVQVSADSTFAASWLDDSTLTVTNRPIVGNLGPSTKYFWRVQARHPFGAGPWSAAWNFTTVPAGADVPALLAPLSPGQNLPVDLMLIWKRPPRAETFQLQVSTAPDFSSYVINLPAWPDTAYALTGLANDTRFYWRVNATNAGGTSAYGTGEFTTIVALPAGVALAAPAHNDSVFKDTVTLSWHPSGPKIIRYQLEISDHPDSGFTPLFLDSGIVDTFRVVVLKQKVTKPYWWRVRARNMAAWTPFTERSIFHAVFPTTALIPKDFVFQGLRPGERAFRFGLPRRAHVTVRLLDIRGRRIMVLLDDYQAAGYHSLDLPRQPGMLLLDFQADRFRKTFRVQGR